MKTYLERINNAQDFDLVHTFQCGQCFRWLKQSDSSYTGVVKGHAFNISKDGQSLIIKSDFPQPETIMVEYLGLSENYSEIINIISQKDEIMKKASEFGYGMRILKQEHWECLASFIISANNFIPRIMKSVERISNMYGKPIDFEGKAYYSFPAPEDLADGNEEKLAQTGIGFRSKYITNAAKMISSGEIDLKTIENMDTNLAREKLMKIPGVGPKIADCVLLFSYSKKDVFPTDVWIKRVVEELYIGREAKLSEIQDFAKKKFGSLAGIAQQYLFYYARENKIGK